MAAMDIEPELVAVVWMDARGAVIVNWDGEPAFERIESEVPPKRRATGSVRRGPARPYGGGRVPGHGTEGRHLDRMREFFGDVAERLADMEHVEISGRGQPHEQFAELLRTLAEKGDGSPTVTTRRLARRPTDPQLAARLRKLTDTQLPRQSSGPYRPEPPATTASGRVRKPSRDDLRKPRPRHLPEHKEIALEIEMLLEDDGPDW